MDSHADQIFTLALEIHRSVRRRFMRAGRTPGEANPLQLFTLFAIQDIEGITMRELANALRITSPSATSFADRLVKYGWIERKKDPKNRKLVRLFITAQGKKVLQQHLREKNEFMRDMLSTIPQKDQQELARIMRSLLQYLSSPLS